MNAAENRKAVNPVWTPAEILALYEKPFLDLIHEAHQAHRQHFPDLSMQLSTLLNIKTGGCPEDCHYCPQAARYHTGVKAEKLMASEAIQEKAKLAKDAGATRFCMGAAWRELKDRDLPKITQIIRDVKAMDLEVCMTLGMLTEEQAKALNEAGLDYYNHNLDTSEEHYSDIISTRTYDERLTTLGHVRASGTKVCCGGIIGLGESREDRAALLATLANLDPYPESVPINRLIPVPGTPLEKMETLDSFEFVRTIAIARLLMPKTRVRLSAGRTTMSEEMQALCFIAGANSMHYGEKLLMTSNPQKEQDRALLQKLKMPIA